METTIIILSSALILTVALLYAKWSENNRIKAIILKRYPLMPNIYRALEHPWELLDLSKLKNEQLQEKLDSCRKQKHQKRKH